MKIELRFARLSKDAPPDATVPVSVHFAGADTEQFPFASPLADADLVDLRWYIERYHAWPVGPDYERAQGIEARLPEMGRALFDAVFKAPFPASTDGYGLYRDS